MNNPENHEVERRLSFKKLVALPRRYIKLVLLTLKIRGRQFRWSMLQYGKTTLLVVVLSVGCLISYWFLQNWSLIVTRIQAVETSILSNVLVGLATVVAGVLALLFSVSLFVVQNAADNYTPTTLERFAHDRMSAVLYIIIGISSLFIFVASVFVKNQSEYTPSLVVTSFFILLLTFILAYWHYSRMAKMVNPVKLLRDWQDETITQMRNVERNMTQTVEWLRLKKRDGKTHDLKREEFESYSKAGFYMSQPAIHNDFERKLRQVYSITKRAAVRRDYEVIETGLAVISNVLRGYLFARRDSTVPLPTSIPFSYSVDYDSLFDRSFQELQEIARIATANTDENLLRNVIDTIVAIGIASVDVVPKSDIPKNNPITDLSLAFVGGIVEEASRHNYTDVCLNGVSGIRSIVQKALSKRVPYIFETSVDYLRKIALIGLIHRKSYIVDRVMESYGVFCHQVVEEDHFDAEGVVEKCLEEVKGATLICLPFIEEPGMQGSLNVTYYLGSFYDMTRQSSIPYLTRRFLPKMKKQSDDDREAERAVHDFTAINKVLWRFYRDIGEKTGKSESFILFYCHVAIEDHVKVILRVIEENNWQYTNSEVQSLIGWHLSFYRVAFEAHEKITKNHHRNMIDFLSWLGMYSVKKNLFDAAKCAAENIVSIAKIFIEKENGFHFEAPRVFMKAIYVMMIAKKNPLAKHVFNQIISELKVFQGAYIKKLQSLERSDKFMEEFRTRLIVEVRTLRRDFEENSSRGRIFREVEDLLFQEVDEADFDEVEAIVKGIVDPLDSTSKQGK